MINWNSEGIFMQFRTSTEIQMFDEMYKASEDGVWKHTMKSRARICKKIHLSEIGFKVALREMLDKELVKKKKRGTYQLNQDIINY